ncbi:decaprenyl-phosphate phosphoribosyltransferase [Marichromatium bheemlicum]|uniref:Decaprenyl-phosphate phosphoribosyltransferase n=1 Tax=Marichromatium bheemlicum TaxID=365339 RepID=A0ABX1I6T6_9GAMM|nr:decaprenyl-phosphate phosphoribosyltransferase [Marichromatium bheemlicum]NKN32881.1 decaprenyl-phosphate phosphoribosyltransferase [Marichromatium bheemlicum]
MIAVLKLARPHQYIKNGFVLLGPLFAHQWDLATLSQALVAFLAFCFMASAVYVLNDIMDIESDRAHPVKCRRPLPSGAISINTAKLLMTSLLAGSLLLSLLVSSWVSLFVASYFVINIFYSLHLKRVVILDVFLISAGFMLRILAGTVGLGIEPSTWLLLCGLMITLFLGFAKRRAELLMLEVNEEAKNGLTRRVLDDYNPAMLEQFIAVTAACTIIAYALYTVSPKTVAIHGSENLIFTLPFVVYGIFRYLFLLHRHSKGNDTAKDLAQDRHLLVTVAAWVGVTLWLLT